MNKKAKIILGVIVVVLIVLGITLTSNNSSDNFAKGTTLEVGFIGAITGEFGMTGQNYIRGLSLAEKDLEAEYEDLEIELVIEDDSFDSTKALTAYNKLVNVNNIDALVNETTPAIEVFYEDVTSRGIPVLQGGEQIRTSEDDNVFQIQPGFYTEEVAADFVAHLKEQGITNPAVLVTEHPILTDRLISRYC
jgi:ABC-type branched-subunit amino acid transport system substrate-binding protein